MSLPGHCPKLEAALKAPGALAELGDGRPVGGSPCHVAALYAAVHGRAISLMIWAVGLWVVTRCRLDWRVYEMLLEDISRKRPISNRPMPPYPRLLSGYTHAANAYIILLLRIAYRACPKPSEVATQILHSMLIFPVMFDTVLPSKECSYVHFKPRFTCSVVDDPGRVGVEQLVEAQSKTTARIRAAAINRLSACAPTGLAQIAGIRAAIQIDPSNFDSYNLLITYIRGSGNPSVMLGNRPLTEWGVLLEALRMCKNERSQVVLLIRMTMISTKWPQPAPDPRLLGISIGEATMPVIDYFSEFQHYRTESICPGGRIIDCLGRGHLWSCRRHYIYDKFTPAHKLFATLMRGLQRLEDEKVCAPSHTAMWEGALESQWTAEDTETLGYIAECDASMQQSGRASLLFEPYA